MLRQTDFRRLVATDYRKWRPLAEASQEEQKADRLTYWETWDDSYLLWGAFAGEELIGYVFWVDATPLMHGRREVVENALKDMDHRPRFGLADLYMVPKWRGLHIPAQLIRAALRDLGATDEEPLALSMPVQAPQGTLEAGLGRSRVVVGYLGPYDPDIGWVSPPTDIHAVIEASKLWIRH